MTQQHLALALIALALIAAGTWMAYRTYLQRHDKSTSDTGQDALVSLWLLTPGFIFAGSMMGLVGMTIALLLISVCAGVVVWLKMASRLEEKKDRSARQALAVELGAAPEQARRDNRRRPFSFVTVLAIYFCACFVFMFLVAAIAYFTNTPEMIDGPNWGLPAFLVPESSELTWWIWAMGGIIGAGVIHGMVNEFRR